MAIVFLLNFLFFLLEADLRRIAAMSLFGIAETETLGSLLFGSVVLQDRAAVLVRQLARSNDSAPLAYAEPEAGTRVHRGVFQLM